MAGCPQNQWQEILGNCDITLFLGCTDALTAQFISDRTGEASIAGGQEIKGAVLVAGDAVIGAGLFARQL